jgi:hypothetical protein
MAITEVSIRHECLAELLEGYIERPLVALPILTERRIQHIRGVGELSLEKLVLKDIASGNF